MNQIYAIAFRNSLISQKSKFLSSFFKSSNCIYSHSVSFYTGDNVANRTQFGNKIHHYGAIQEKMLLYVTEVSKFKLLRLDHNAFWRGLAATLYLLASCSIKRLLSLRKLMRQSLKEQESHKNLYFLNHSLPLMACQRYSLRPKHKDLSRNMLYLQDS